MALIKRTTEIPNDAIRKRNLIRKREIKIWKDGTTLFIQYLQQKMYQQNRVYGIN